VIQTIKLHNRATASGILPDSCGLRTRTHAQPFINKPSRPTMCLEHVTRANSGDVAPPTGQFSCEQFGGRDNAGETTAVQIHGRSSA